MNGPVPVGCAFAYSLRVGDSSVPPTASASYSARAVGLCIENAGSESAAMKPANGCVSVTVACVASSAVHES